MDESSKLIDDEENPPIDVQEVNVGFVSQQRVPEEKKKYEDEEDDEDGDPDNLKPAIRKVPT